MKYLLLFALAFAAFSCEKTIDLDPRQVPDRLVIDARITTDVDRHSIDITRVRPFGDTGAVPAVSGAIVTVSDDAGNSYPFFETEPGVYQPTEAFAGVSGRTYLLEVEAEGKTYTAEETMTTIGPIEKLEYRRDDDPEDPDEEEYVYEVLVYVDEPAETEDFYLVEFYRNDTLLNDNGREVFVFDDRALTSDINSLPIPYNYRLGDSVRIAFYSLTRGAFRFYNDLYNNINNDGGMFGGQPANVRTNIKGGALGYFRATAVSHAGLSLE